MNFENPPPWLEIHLEREHRQSCAFLICHHCGDETQVDFGDDEALAAEQLDEECARHGKCVEHKRTGAKSARWREEHQRVVS